MKKLNEGAWGTGATQSDGAWDNISEVYHKTIDLIINRANIKVEKKDEYDWNDADNAFDNINMIQYYLALFSNMEAQNSKTKEIIELRKIYMKNLDIVKNCDKFIQNWNKDCQKYIKWRIDNAEEIFDKLTDPDERYFQPLADIVEKILGGNKAYDK